MCDIEKEKQEAIEAGRRALKSLTNAQNELNSARWCRAELIRHRSRLMKQFAE